MARALKNTNALLKGLSWSARKGLKDGFLVRGSSTPRWWKGFLWSGHPLGNGGFGRRQHPSGNTLREVAAEKSSVFGGLRKSSWKRKAYFWIVFSKPRRSAALVLRKDTFVGLRKATVV